MIDREAGLRLLAFRHCWTLAERQRHESHPIRRSNRACTVVMNSALSWPLHARTHVLDYFICRECSLRNSMSRAEARYRRAVNLKRPLPHSCGHSGELSRAVRKYWFERTRRPCTAVPPTGIDQRPIVFSLRLNEGPRGPSLHPKTWATRTRACFPRRGENTMRRTLPLACTALVAAILAIWGTTGTVATSPKKASVDPSIDVMQMMRNARNLPEQQFDAN